MFDEKSILYDVKDDVLRTIIYKILKNSDWSVEEIAKVLEVDEEIVEAVRKNKKVRAIQE